MEWVDGPTENPFDGTCLHTERVPGLIDSQPSHIFAPLLQDALPALNMKSDDVFAAGILGKGEVWARRVEVYHLKAEMIVRPGEADLGYTSIRGVNEDCLYEHSF